MAQIVGPNLLYGEVTEICGLSRSSRRLDERVRRLLHKPPDEWRYTIAWPNTTSAWTRESVLGGIEVASAIEVHVHKVRLDAPICRVLATAKWPTPII